jgi:hypothetical protein
MEIYSKSDKSKMKMFEIFQFMNAKNHPSLDDAKTVTMATSDRRGLV